MEEVSLVCESSTAGEVMLSAPRCAAAGVLAASRGLRTEFAFVLPRGYVDDERGRPPRRRRCGWPRPRTRSCRSAIHASARTRRTSRCSCCRGSSPGSASLSEVTSGHRREPVRLRPGIPPGPVPTGQPGGHQPGRRHAVPPASTSSRSTWRAEQPGGIVTYATDRLFEEVAYVAYHFHWSIDEILDLEHPDRQRFVEEIGRINERLNE